MNVRYLSSLAVAFALLVAGGCAQTTVQGTDKPPSVVIVQPADGTTKQEGEVWTFRVTVDDDHGAEKVKMRLESDHPDVGFFSTGDFPDQQGNFEVAFSDFPLGDHLITASGTDESGQTSTDSITIRVVAAGGQPTCLILEPSIGPSLPNFPNFDMGGPIFFEAEVADDLTACDNLAVEWRSSLDPTPIFSGVAGSSCLSSFTYTDLPEGSQTVTLTVTDEETLIGTCEIFLTLHDPLAFDNDGDCYCESEPCTGSADSGCLSVLGGDCDDTEIGVYPGAAEICDGFDTNCDTVIPPEETTDADGDGSPACLDCDENDATVYPNAPELCDGLDNDCNANSADGSSEGWFQVVCGTNEGECSEGLFLCQGGNQVCAGEVIPVDEDFSTGAPSSVRCDGLDNDCDGIVDEDVQDQDGDGANECIDCDDTSSSLNLIDIDNDGYTSCDGDCNDLDPNVNPGATEVCNGVDDDCNGLQDAGNPGWPQQETDDDGDGASECQGDCDDTDATQNILDADGDGLSSCGGDCNDLDANSYPGAIEICDGLDNDCNGADDVLGFPGSETDNDGDGQSECEGDCDDLNAQRYTGMVELCDGIDNDCNGLDDAGNPGVAGQETDDDGDGVTECAGDCDDTNAAVRPGQTEACDGIDNDCNGLDDAGAPGVGGQETDSDGDGQWICQGDCDDTNAANFSGNTEICDGGDNDCNGLDDYLGFAGSETDNDGDFMSECQGDCDDTNASIFLGATETCNGADNDCDGIVDTGGATLCLPPVQVATTDCGGVNGCFITACNANQYDSDATFSNGCECADDAVPALCSGALDLGALNPGDLVPFAGVIPTDLLSGTAGDDWFVVRFPITGRAPTNGTPTITFGVNDGGDYKFEIYLECAAGAVCAGDNYSYTDSAFSDPSWIHSGTDGPVVQDPWPAVAYVRVYRAAAVVPCGGYQLLITR